MSIRKPEKTNPFPSDKIIRRMGYPNDQEGIMRRYINEEGNWNEHLNKSKAYIRQCIAKHKPESVAVLGSGWLLDVPLDFLSENCKSVYLYDIRHPRQVIQKIKSCPNIEAINMDVSGGAIECVYNHLNARDFDSVSNLPKLRFTPVKPVDYTISLNLLNQLDILIVEYLRKFPQVADEAVLQLRKKLQLAHLNSLSADKSCLITDYEELIYDRTDNLVGSSSIVFNKFPNGKNVEEWIWKFDGQMTYYPNRKTYFKVKAMEL